MRNLSISKLLVVALLIVLSGCSKIPQEVVKEDVIVKERFPVTFNITHLSQPDIQSDGEPVSSQSADNLADHITNIRYVIYDRAKIPMEDKHLNIQTSSNWGAFSESLPVGKYLLMMFATKNTGNIFYNLNYYYTGKMILERETKGNDVFMKEIEFTVGEEPSSLDIQLERIVGSVALALEDEIPNNVGRIVLELRYVSNEYDLREKSYMNNSPMRSEIIPEVNEVTGESGWDLDGLTIYFLLNKNQNATVTVNIKAYAKDNKQLVIDKTIQKVPVGINLQTVLTGRLFQTVNQQARSSFSSNDWSVEMKSMN